MAVGKLRKEEWIRKRKRAIGEEDDDNIRAQNVNGGCELSELGTRVLTDFRCQYVDAGATCYLDDSG
jgi:hypothetical protein